MTAPISPLGIVLCFVYIKPKSILKHIVVSFKVLSLKGSLGSSSA